LPGFHDRQTLLPFAARLSGDCGRAQGKEDCSDIFSEAAGFNVLRAGTTLFVGSLNQPL
jgi:hypothetical protein